MKLDELIPQNKTYEELQDLFLVFDAQFLPQLIHAQNDQPNHRVQPIPLNDGRYVLSADVLTEIGEKGIYKAAFARLNNGNFKFVEVLTTAELEPLKVVYPEE
jgi:hypothetical protein